MAIDLSVVSDWGTEITLWGAQDDRENTSGNVNTTPFSTFDSEEAFLVGMTEQQTGTLTGRVTGNRLSKMSGYSDDPVVALAEWAQLLMSFVNGAQGEGHTVTSGLRGYDDVPVSFGAVGWGRTAGQPFELSWDVEWQVGGGVMATVTEQPINEVSIGSGWYLDGHWLQHPVDYRENKSEQLNTIETLLADSAAENLTSSESGAVRRITITGKIKGSSQEQRAFNDYMKDLVGDDQIVQYESAFPGHTLDVMVDNYSSTYEAGRVRDSDYTLDLVEGTKD